MDRPHKRLIPFSMRQVYSSAPWEGGDTFKPSLDYISSGDGQTNTILFAENVSGAKGWHVSRSGQRTHPLLRHSKSCVCLPQSRLALAPDFLQIQMPNNNTRTVLAPPVGDDNADGMGNDYEITKTPCQGRISLLREGLCRVRVQITLELLSTGSLMVRHVKFRIRLTPWCVPAIDLAERSALRSGSKRSGELLTRSIRKRNTI